ncbi:MAG: hypothetical protein GX275_13195 [Clostridiales bacterium]|nr:hypothetical protein [Clostridiales bacterium]
MSGEIQLLIDSIKNVYGNEICNWAVSGCKFDNNEEENIKELLNKISDMCGDESLDKVLKIRGRQCISLDLLGKVKVLQEKSNDVYDFIENLNKEGIPGGEIKIKDNKIIITYPECLCEHAKK